MGKSRYDYPEDRKHNLAASLQFVYPAYTLSEDRTDAINRRLETVIAAPLAIIPAFIIASQGNNSIICVPFILGVICFIVAIALALWRRTRLTVEVLELDEIVRVADTTQESFGERMLLATERDIAKNAKANQKKGTAAFYSTLLVTGGLVCLIVWLAL